MILKHIMGPGYMIILLCHCNDANINRQVISRRGIGYIN